MPRVSYGVRPAGNQKWSAAKLLMEDVDDVDIAIELVGINNLLMSRRVSGLSLPQHELKESTVRSSRGSPGDCRLCSQPSVTLGRGCDAIVERSPALVWRVSQSSAESRPGIDHSRNFSAAQAYTVAVHNFSGLLGSVMTAYSMVLNSFRYRIVLQ